MEQNRKPSHFLCSGPNFQFPCSGPNMLNDLKIGRVFNLCYRLGHIPVFKSLHSLVASCNFTRIPLNFLHFCNMSLVKFDPFHHCSACGNADALTYLHCLPSVPSMSPHAKAPESLFWFSLFLVVPYLADSFDLGFVGLSGLRGISFWWVLPVQQNISSN